MEGGISYLTFLIPGLVMMGVLNNSYQNTSSTIVSGKFTGDILDLRVVPLSNFQIIWAISLAGLVRGLMVGTITFLVGQLFCFYVNGFLITVNSPFLVLFFSVFGGLSFAMMGGGCGHYWAKEF